MPRKKDLPIKIYPRDPLSMDSEDLFNLFYDSKKGKYSYVQIIRSLLIYEYERIINSEEEIETRSLRSLWYSLIKPVISRLPYIDTKVDWNQKLISGMSELAKEGLVSYEDMRIIDTSRLKDIASPQYLITRQIPSIGAYHPHIILFTEKNTIYHIIENLALVYGVSAYSGSGQSSRGATENFIKTILKHPNCKDELTIYMLTDYNPHGFDIADTILDQIETVIDFSDTPIKKILYRRIGVFPSDLTPEELEKNTQELKTEGVHKKMFEDWFYARGRFKKYFRDEDIIDRVTGVNGKPEGIELDALTTRKIKAMYIDWLHNDVGFDDRYRLDLAKCLVDLLIWESVEGEVNRLIDGLKERIKYDELIDSLPWYHMILQDLAEQGHGIINPLELDEVIFDSATRIRDLIKDA